MTRPEPFASLAVHELVDAVTGIVAIAAQRARQAGCFAALRGELLCILGDGALDDVADPRDDGAPELPTIDDAVAALEAARLAALRMHQEAGRRTWI